MQTELDRITPTKGFCVPPYRVEEFPGHFGKKWYAIVNKNGFNCLNFPQKPGVKFTSDYERAKQICDAWNDTANQTPLT